MFHPFEWVSHTQTAPGVLSRSTTDGTESCLSLSEQDLVWSRGALAKPQQIVWKQSDNECKDVWHRQEVFAGLQQINKRNLIFLWERNVSEGCINSGWSTLCGHRCQVEAARQRGPTFNRVDIWKPCGFSVSPPGQMIFRWLFITTCSDDTHTHVSSPIGEHWQRSTDDEAPTVCVWPSLMIQLYVITAEHFSYSFTNLCLYVLYLRLSGDY